MPGVAAVLGHVQLAGGGAHGHQAARGGQRERVDVVAEAGGQVVVAGTTAAGERGLGIAQRAAVDRALRRAGTGGRRGQQPALGDGRGPAVGRVQALVAPRPGLAAVVALAHAHGGGHRHPVALGHHLVVVGLGRDHLDPAGRLPAPHPAHVHPGVEAGGADGDGAGVGRPAPGRGPAAAGGDGVEQGVPGGAVGAAHVDQMGVARAHQRAAAVHGGDTAGDQPAGQRRDRARVQGHDPAVGDGPVAGHSHHVSRPAWCGVIRARPGKDPADHPRFRPGASA